MTVAEGRARGARCPTPDLRQHKSQLSHRQKQLARWRILKRTPNRRGFIDDLKLTRRQVVGSKRDDDRYCIMLAATATLPSFRLAASAEAAVYIKSARDQNTERDLRRTWDDERPTFNPHNWIAIAISVATIERLYLPNAAAAAGASETAGD